MAADPDNIILEWFEYSLKKTGIAQYKLADRMGINGSAITRILKRERQLSASELISAQRIFNEEAIYNGLPDDDMNNISGFIELHARARFQSDAALSYLKAKYRDNPVTYVPSITEAWNVISVPQFYLHDKKGFSNPCWMSVDDEAMSPTLVPGDIVIIDMDVHVPNAPGLYVLSIDEARMMVRRLDLSPSRSSHEDQPIRIAADNPRYPEWTEALTQVNIVGKCMARISRRFD